MFTSPFFRRLFLPYFLLICAATAAVGFFAAHTLRASYVANQTEALRDHARLVSHALSAHLASPDLAPTVAKLARSIGARITIMRADGVVLADSEAHPTEMENHKDRPEFLDAASPRGEGAIERTSGTVHAPLLYLARPMTD